jgi:hypothetical protein
VALIFATNSTVEHERSLFVALEVQLIGSYYPATNLFETRQCNGFEETLPAFPGTSNRKEVTSMPQQRVSIELDDRPGALGKICGSWNKYRR